MHGIGGMVGALLTGLCATTVDQPGRCGRPVLRQRRAAPACSSRLSAVCAAYSFVVSWGLLKLVDKLIGLRVTEDEENIGLDLTQHSESAYTVVG